MKVTDGRELLFALFLPNRLELTLFSTPVPSVWLMRAGVVSRPSVEVVNVKVLDPKTGELELLVACKHIADRGATLGGELPLG